MSKKFKSRLKLALMVAFLLASIPVAVWADSWKYYTNFTVKDTSSAARTYVPVLVDTIKGQSLIDAGRINSSATDTRTREGSTDREFLITNERLAFVIPSLAADQTRTYKLYMGYSPVVTDFPVIVGTGGYITVADNDKLELGDTFEVEQKGYIETSSGATKNLAYKEGAFRTFVSAEEEITSVFGPTWVLPTGFVDPDTAWADEGQAYDNNIATDATDEAPSGGWSAYLELTHAAINCNSIKFHCDCTGADLGDAAVDIYYGAAWHNVYDEATAESTWITVTFDPQIITAARFKGENGNDDFPKNINLDELHLGEVATVTAINVESGEHEVKTTGDGTNLVISIDEAVAGDGYDTTTFGAVTWGDTANNWLLEQNDCIPYVEYHKMKKGASDNLWLQPEVMTTGTNLIDRESDSYIADSGTTTTLIDAALTEADDYWNNTELRILTTVDGLAPQGESITVTNFVAADDELQFDALTAVIDTGDTYELGNDGVITWGTNSDLTIVIGSTSTYEDTTPAATGATATNILTPAKEPEDWWGTASTIASLPLYDTFNDAATEIGMPTQTLYLMMMLGLASAIGLSVLIFTGSVLMAALATGTIMAVEVGTTIMGSWVVFVFAILATGILYLSRQT